MLEHCFNCLSARVNSNSNLNSFGLVWFELELEKRKENRKPNPDPNPPQPRKEKNENRQGNQSNPARPLSFPWPVSLTRPSTFPTRAWPSPTSTALAQQARTAHPSPCSAPPTRASVTHQQGGPPVSHSNRTRDARVPASSRCHAGPTVIPFLRSPRARATAAASARDPRGFLSRTRTPQSLGGLL